MCNLQLFGCVSVFPQLLVYQIYGPLFLRLALAAVFFVHGYRKLFGGISETVQFFESIKITPAKFCTYLIGGIEFFGSILLIIGVFVQAVSLLFAVIMITVIAKVKFKKGFMGGYDFEFVLLVISLALLVLGPGAFSIDFYF